MQKYIKLQVKELSKGWICVCASTDLLWIPSSVPDKFPGTVNPDPHAALRSMCHGDWKEEVTPV